MTDPLPKLGMDLNQLVVFVMIVAINVVFCSPHEDCFNKTYDRYELPYKGKQINIFLNYLVSYKFTQIRAEQLLCAKIYSKITRNETCAKIPKLLSRKSAKTNLFWCAKICTREIFYMNI